MRKFKIGDDVWVIQDDGRRDPNTHSHAQTRRTHHIHPHRQHATRAMSSLADSQRTQRTNRQHDAQCVDHLISPMSRSSQSVSQFTFIHSSVLAGTTLEGEVVGERDGKWEVSDVLPLYARARV